MNERAQCQSCGEIFYPDQHWKTMCIPCFKISKARENADVSELDELRAENARLYLQLRKLAADAMPPAMLRQLIRLAHPDKHGNSQAANDATAWLLSQRFTA
jgi:hypothetical protein